ncbi:hypothetical protein Moror_11913 [Moniliophthora roreri MCA 2997]|uniref:Protein kinase domain-containing protein n=1 Tax=Moniliophthora roreri (strain MCA 2997) TaxID=1381753 RepID=V2WJR5_MONRO|nr:hypothetical protein Moror_11913 [Moniliophthora roreri MCA 2997]
MPVAELWCIDITGPPSVVTRRIFPINFNPQHNFEDFNQAIRDQLKHQPIGNDEPITLDVWKLNPSIARNDVRFNEGTTTTYDDLKEHVTTITTDSGHLGDIYLDLPEEESLHLLVSLQGGKTAEGTIYHLCSELLDIKEKDRQRKTSEWYDTLGDNEFENRSDVKAKRQQGQDPFREIPLALLHPVFDRFLLHIHTPHLEIPHTLYPLAIKLSSACWKTINDDKPTRVDRVLPIIEQMANCTFIKRTEEGAAFDGLYRVDGRCPALIFIADSDIGSQLLGRVERVYAKCVQLASLDSTRKFVVLPTFILLLAGSHITVLAAANLSYPVLEPLTSFQVCTSMPSDPGEVFENLARLFTCLRSSLEMLREYYTALPSLLELETLPKRYLPMRNTFDESGTGRVRRLRYESLLMLGKNIWRGRLENNSSNADTDADHNTTPVLIKFTRSYCTPAHQLLSSIDAAPKLYYSDSPNSDAYYWQMVVMEYLPTPPTTTLYDFEGTPAEARQVGEDLKRAVGTLHDQGYVFGDLRPSNILVEPEADGEGRRIRVALVDFDWAGKEGEVRYPVGISVNGGINWPEGVVPRGLITKEHDEYWLRTWLDCLS